MTETVRLATRGSELARRQAGSVRERLASSRRTVELVEVSTRGDELRDELIHRLGRTGAFVRALDEKVLSGELDAAVHSMKDMPTEPTELVVAGVPERAPVGDVLVTPDGATIEELPAGAVVGTSSLRRRAQLLAERPDLEVAPLRGNVDTRVEKLLAPTLQREHQRRTEAESETGDGADGNDGADGSDGNAGGYERSVDEWFDDLAEIERRALGHETDTEYDAIVLAEAGLSRAGLLDSLSYQRLPIDRFVPAPGQGAIAVTARDDETGTLVNKRVDHPRTRVETGVERTVLAELGGGCVAPIGVYAVVEGAYVHVTARVLDRDGTEEVARTRDLPIETYRTAAREFAADLADAGAGELVERATREADGTAGTREEPDRSDDADRAGDGDE